MTILYNVLLFPLSICRRNHPFGWFLFCWGRGEKMDNNTFMSIIEMMVGITVEGIILAFIFQWVSNKATEKQQQNLQQEMQNLEKQNRFDFEQIMKAIQISKTELISQIKESNEKGGK
jgi:hypothetical protein